MSAGDERECRFPDGKSKAEQTPKKGQSLQACSEARGVYYDLKVAMHKTWRRDMRAKIKTRTPRREQTEPHDGRTHASRMLSAARCEREATNKHSSKKKKNPPQLVIRFPLLPPSPPPSVGSLYDAAPENTRRDAPRERANSEIRGGRQTKRKTRKGSGLKGGRHQGKERKELVARKTLSTHRHQPRARPRTQPSRHVLDFKSIATGL